MKLSKILILVALISSVLLSGCLEQRIQVNESNMQDREIINSFCQSKGYDRGLTTYLDGSEFWKYRDQHPQRATDSIYSGNREVVCIKTTTSSDWFDYDDLFKWIKNI